MVSEAFQLSKMCGKGSECWLVLFDKAVLFLSFDGLLT